MSWLPTIPTSIKAAVLRGTLALVVLTLASPTIGAAAPVAQKDEVVVGALVSLTGGWSSLGMASQAALEIALDDVNRDILAGSARRVRLEIEDTRLDPAIALDKLQALASRGVRIVVGPQSSAELAALKPFADANGILLISQGSTASSLAVAGDNVLRFIPDDTHEIEALSALIAADGIKTVVPIWRTDTGNDGLQRSLRAIFPRTGGTVLEGVSYAPESRSVEDEVAALSAMVATAGDPASVGVYLAAFDEVTDVFEQARRDPLLSAVKWYGSDGVALSKALVGHAEAARFAATVGYPNPNVGLDEQYRQRWQPIADRIRAKSDGGPDVFALAAYDAGWVSSLTLLAVGDAEGPGMLRTAFMRITDSYIGLSGPIPLNEAGDRATGTYDFWVVREGPTGFGWQRLVR